MQDQGKSSSLGPTTDLWKRKDDMLQTLTAQWQNNKPQRDRILKTTQHHGEQMFQGLQTLGEKLQKGSTDLLANKNADPLKLKEHVQTVGSKLSKLSLSNIVPGGILASSTTKRNTSSCENDLNMFNERMKEEMMRRDVRREAEQACLQTMREHLETFLPDHQGATYEEWIFAFHPENTQDVSLIMEHKEVDERFYVEESDHRRLWNETVTDPSRQVVARTRIFSSPEKLGTMIDLLGETTTTTTQEECDKLQPPVYEDIFHHGKSPVADSPAVVASTQEVDLLSF